MTQVPDIVCRRVILEFGRQYVYATLTSADGKILEEEVWKQPYPIDAREAAEDAREAWHAIHQHVQDALVFPSASEGEKDGTPEE